MPQSFPVIAAGLITVAFVVAGTILLAQVIEARIGDLRNERDFLRAQLIDANERNEELQRQNGIYRDELHFSDGALNEARSDSQRDSSRGGSKK